MRIKFIQNTIDFLRGKKSIKKALQKYRQNKRQKALIAKYLNDSKCLIIYPPQGLGDILYICLLLSEYKKRQKNSNAKGVFCTACKAFL